MSIKLDSAKGITLPTFTTEERDAILNPNPGSIFYNSSLDRTEVFNNGVIPQPTGIILQVIHSSCFVQAVSSSSNYAHTGLVGLICPLQDNSRILIQAHINGCMKTSSDTSIWLRLTRGNDLLEVFESVGSISENNNTVGHGTSSVTYEDISTIKGENIYYYVDFASSANSGTVYCQVNNTVQAVSHMTIWEIAGL